MARAFSPNYIPFESPGAMPQAGMGLGLWPEAHAFITSDHEFHHSMSIKKQTLWSMAPLLIVTVVNIFSVPLFLQYLGEDRYALWFYVLTFSGSFGFMDLGLGVAVGRYIGVALGRGDREAVRGYWATGNAVAIPLLGAMAALFVFLGAVFGPGWFNVKPGDELLLRWSFVAGGVSLFVSYYAQFWNILSQAHLDFKFISLLRVAVSLVQVLPAIVLARMTQNPLILITWSALVGAVQLLVFIWHSRVSYGLGFHFREASMARLREMGSYTGKTFATLLVGSFLGSVDRLLLGKLAPATVFASYTVATNVGGRIQGLSVAIMGPVFHNTSRAVGSEGKSSPAAIYNETFRFTFGWYLLASVWISVWHPFLLNLWLGPVRGANVALVFAPIIVAYCFSAVSSISAAQLGPLNRVGTGLFFNVFTGLLTAVCVYGGWTMAGAQGVAYGYLLSRAGLVAQDLFVIRLIHAGGWLSRETWVHIFNQCSLGGIFYFLSRAHPTSLLWLGALAALHGAGVSVWLLNRSGVKFSLRRGSSLSLP